MTDPMQKLRDSFNADIQRREAVIETERGYIEFLQGALRHMDEIERLFPIDPAPVPNGRAPRRDLQSIVLAAVENTPLAVSRIHDKATGAVRAGDITEGSVKRVLDALVKKGKVVLSGTDGYRLPGGLDMSTGTGPQFTGSPEGS